jgi:hypothetical protein
VKFDVPIHVGGHSPAAARRAGRYGDGFFPTVANPEKLQELFDIVKSEARKAGRDPDKIEFTAMSSMKLDHLKALADIGVSRVVTTPPSSKPEVLSQALEKLQNEVIARM